MALSASAVCFLYKLHKRCTLNKLQGRTSWWNPKSSEEEAEEEEDEEREEEPEPEPEVGPPLLTPLSEDAPLNEQPAWSARLSSKLVPQYSVAVVDSCLWPGAHAFCSGT